jgi:hypothetical protein
MINLFLMMPFYQVPGERPPVQHGGVCCGLELSTRLSHEPSQQVCRLVKGRRGEKAQDEKMKQRKICTLFSSEK